MNSILEIKSHLPLHALVSGVRAPGKGGRHQDRILDCFDLLFTRQGAVPIQEEERAYHLTEGQTLILWPHRHHWGIGAFAPDTRLYWLHFTIEDAAKPSKESIFGCELSVPQHASVVRPDVLELLFRRFIDDQATGRLLPHEANLLLLLMLSEVADQRPLELAAYVSNGDSTPAERARAYIQAFFHVPLTVAHIAENLGYNADYLNRVFRKTYNRTLMEELHRARIEHARHLLLYGASDIKEVARKCGFKDVSYFSRLFKRHEKVTPIAFRRLNQPSDVHPP